MAVAGEIMVRPAQSPDVPRVVELLQQMSLPGENREGDPHDPAYGAAFVAILADPRQVLLVAEQARVIVGTATLIITPNLSHRGRSVATIENVVVDKGVRGCGIGAALARHCLKEAQRRGCFRVQLTSHKDRLDAHRFWSGLGFTPTHLGFKL